MRIIEQDNDYIYVIADNGKILWYKDFFAVGHMISKDDLNLLKETSNAELLQYLKERDRLISK